MHISDRASLSTDPSKWINVDHATLAVRIHVFSSLISHLFPSEQVRLYQNLLGSPHDKIRCWSIYTYGGHD